MDFLRGRIASPTMAPATVESPSVSTAKIGGSSSSGHHRRGDDMRSPLTAIPEAASSSAPVVAPNNSRPKKGYLARAFSSKNSFNKHSNQQMSNPHTMQAQQIPSSSLPSFSFFRSTSRSKNKQDGDGISGSKMAAAERSSSSEEETSTNNSSSHHHSSNSSRASSRHYHPTQHQSDRETLPQSPSQPISSLTLSQSPLEQSQYQKLSLVSTDNSGDSPTDPNAQIKENMVTPEGFTAALSVDEKSDKTKEQSSVITVNLVTNDSTDRGAMKLDELDVSITSPIAPSSSATAASKPVVGDGDSPLNSNNGATSFASSNHKLFRVFDVLGDGSGSDNAKEPLDSVSGQKKETKQRRISLVSKTDTNGDVIQQHPPQQQPTLTATANARETPRSQRIPGRRTSLVELDAAGIDAAIATAQEHQRRAPQALLKPYDVLSPSSTTTASAGLGSSGGGNAGVINSNIRRRASIATTTPSISGSHIRSRSFVLTPPTLAPAPDPSPVVPAFPFTTTIQAVYSHRTVTLTLLTRAEVRQRLLSRPQLLPCRPGLQLSPVKQRPVPLETHAAAPAMSPRQRYLQQQAQQRAQLEVAAMTMNALAAELLDSDVYLCMHRSESLHLGLSAVPSPPTSLNELVKDAIQTPTDPMGNDPHVAEEWFYIPLSRLVTLDVDVKRSGHFRFLLTPPHAPVSATATTSSSAAMSSSIMKTPAKTPSPTSSSSTAHHHDNSSNHGRSKNHGNGSHTHKVEACLYVRTLDVAPGPSLFASLIHNALLGDHRSRVLTTSTEQNPIAISSTKPAQNAAAMRFRHQLQQQQLQSSTTSTTNLFSTSKAVEDADTAGYVSCLLQATSPEILPAWLQTLLHLHRTIQPNAH